MKKLTSSKDIRYAKFCKVTIAIKNNGELVKKKIPLSIYLNQYYQGKCFNYSNQLEYHTIMKKSASESNRG